MSEQNKIDEIKDRLRKAPVGSGYYEDVSYLLQEIERLQGEVVFWKVAAENQKDNNMKLISVIHDKDEKAREAIKIWETATPEDDFDDIMHAVIDEIKDSLAL
ncbi:hypothetical protein BBD41_03255 [Paenibacillus ihbetae]|uniref:Uncharacterized protein n=1 Tax=Paenibacillus ihbetae TaxID=1870820 RepID=A0A1B2DVG2_9BACL|nr:hypothetical protein [Paenibacillus ihbetae]ANY71677.1 hypothetical protein BBD41_03255 [Paenibacillus ihbetae]